MTHDDPIKAKLASALASADALDESIDERIKAYWSVGSKLLPDVAVLYDNFVERIAGNEADRLAPQTGDLMPEFVLPDLNGALVMLSGLLAKGPVVVSFNRGNWCPFCMLELKGLARAYSEIAATGAEVVSIVPETAEFSSTMHQKYGLPFNVLSDMDLGYALENALVVSIDEELKQRYLKVGINLPHYQKNGAWLIPTPATFVVGADGLVKARFVNTDFRRRMPVAEILAALRSLDHGR